MSDDTGPAYRSIWPQGSGIRLHTVEAGPAKGETMLLLHGFPEYWWGWRNQIAPLAKAGLRVIAPDLRGYGDSDVPDGLDAYRLEMLVADVIALADDLTAERFHLVGHDWGGIIAWAVAARHPERVRRLSILNAPHLDASQAVFRQHPTQWLRSAYIGFFQLDGVAEAALRMHDFAMLRRAIAGSGKPTTFAPDSLDRYAAQWAKPGRLTAMLSYYRALVRRSREPLGRISPPTQILWGMQDSALAFPLAEASLEMCDDGRLVRFPDATHWLQLDEPEAVVRALLAFDR